MRQTSRMIWGRIAARPFAGVVVGRHTMTSNRGSRSPWILDPGMSWLIGKFESLHRQLHPLCFAALGSPFSVTAMTQYRRLSLAPTTAMEMTLVTLDPALRRALLIVLVEHDPRSSHPSFVASDSRISPLVCSVKIRF